jgi:hypothetical protein
MSFGWGPYLDPYGRSHSGFLQEQHIETEGVGINNKRLRAHNHKAVGTRNSKKPIKVMGLMSLHLYEYEDEYEAIRSF